MSRRIVVPYQHDPADLASIELAVTSGRSPSEQEWNPALRDIIDGEYVVRISTDHDGETVWVRDRGGVRQVAGPTRQRRAS